MTTQPQRAPRKAPERASARGSAPGSFYPEPGSASLPRMILAQTALETRMLLRNGEQLLLTIVIPALLLVLFSAVPLIATPGGSAGSGSSGGSAQRVDYLAPGLLALAVLSTAFTGQAIATGFERRYGVLKRLGASPLPRWGLMSAKTCCVLAVEVLQLVLLSVLALLFGWSPAGDGFVAVVSVVLLLVLGTAAFSGLGLLMAGTLRAEATLAAANLVFVLLLVAGGVVVPLENFPDALHAVLQFLPISALSEGLRSVLQDGAGVPWAPVGILAAWAVLALGTASRWFRWE